MLMQYFPLDNKSVCYISIRDLNLSIVQKCNHIEETFFQAYSMRYNTIVIHKTA